jgi:flagellar hook protein FlgE
MSGLNSIFATALSGLNAAGAVLHTTANNIANADSHGYKAARANLTSAPYFGGVRVGSVSIDAAKGAPDPDGGQELSNVDLVTERLNLGRGQHLYKANAAVVRVADRMMGTLLDMYDTRRLGRR